MIRFLIFLLISPLIVLGTIGAILMGLRGGLMGLRDIASVPAVGLRWLRVWWQWVKGEITTWELIT